MVLTSKDNQIVLRLIRPEDAALTFAWRQSEKARYLHAGARTVAEQLSWIERHTGEDNFIIQFEGLPVGMISLIRVDRENRSAELARELIPSAPASVVFRAERLLLDYAFRTLKLHRVHGFFLANNGVMLTMRKYQGWQVEGRLRQNYIWHGEYVDTLLVGLLEKEYEEICRPKLLILGGEDASD